ncbi:hypothetical protein IAT38_000543 [Cryptococcus sp. DSM 104549]
MTFNIPLSLLLPPPLFLAFFLTYLKLAPRFSSERQRAYLLSTLSSATMTLISLPFVSTYLIHGLECAFEDGQEGWMASLGQFGVVFFGTYLFGASSGAVILAIGYAKYPSQVGFLTGWIHHTVYIALMVYLINTRLSPIFLVAGVMELPTFDLAISNLFPRVRHDARFLSSFFLIRITFHLYLFIDCVRPASRAITDGSWMPTIMLALAGVLHVAWFKGGLMGYLKRRKAMRENKGVEVEAVDLAEGPATEKVVEPVVDGPVDINADPNSGLHTPPTPDLSPSTPDDSPLVTPRTPSQTPYFFPSLSIPSIPSIPSLTNLPTLPNMPTVSIPAIPSISGLSLAEIKAAVSKERERMVAPGGFKDAVRSRWEEQRGRFAEKVGLSVSGLSLRRGGGGNDEGGGEVAGLFDEESKVMDQ